MDFWPEVVERAREIVLASTLSVTLRQTFYRLVAEAVIDNTLYDYKKLSEVTADLRRDGSFPPLIDHTRQIVRAVAFDSPADALDVLADEYREPRLAGQAVTPLLVVEKATLVTLLSTWFTDPWGVSVAPLRGYSSVSYEQDIQHEVDTSSTPTKILYLGDFDPSGEDIQRNFQAKTGLTVHRRVALTRDQIAQYDLPPQPGKVTDSRAAAFTARHGELVQVEIEALPPDVLYRLVERELDALVDVSLIARVCEREHANTVRLRALADGFI